MDTVQGFRVKEGLSCVFSRTTDFTLNLATLYPVSNVVQSAININICIKDRPMTKSLNATITRISNW